MRSAHHIIGVVAAACCAPVIADDLLVQEQFLHGADPAAGQYTALSPLHGQGPTGGTILGYHGLWEAPYDPAGDTGGSAYPDSIPLTYVRGDDELATDGGSFRFVRTSGVSGTRYSWRAVDAGDPRDEWWASFLIQLQDDGYSWLLLEWDADKYLEFGLATHGVPRLDRYWSSEPVGSHETHLIVMHAVGNAGPDGSYTRTRMWVDPPLLPGPDGEPTAEPLLEGYGTGLFNEGPRTLEYVTIMTHSHSGYAIWLDEIRVGTSWAAVVPLNAPEPCNAADVAAPLGTLNIDDVLAFLNAFSLGNPLADLAPPEDVLDIDDVLLFLGTFAAGCP